MRQRACTILGIHRIAVAVLAILLLSASAPGPAPADGGPIAIPATTPAAPNVLASPQTAPETPLLADVVAAEPVAPAEGRSYSYRSGLRPARDPWEAVAPEVQAAASAVELPTADLTETTPTAQPAALPTAPPIPKATPVQTPNGQEAGKNLAGKLRIGLQAGHWRYWELPPPLNARGTAGGGKTEPEVTLDLATRAAAILRGFGYAVDILPADLPNGYSAAAVVAIHCDGAESASRRGFFVDRAARSTIAAVESRFQRVLADAFAAATGLSYVYRGTVNSQYYYGYQRVAAQTPMVLIETGFLTNPQDRQLLLAEPDKAAQGIANGIRDFLAR